MSKRKGKASKRRTTKRLDTDSIRDFFNYLKWELRIGHFEQTHPGTVNKELGDQLVPMVKKYEITGVLPMYGSFSRKAKAKAYQECLDHLEALTEFLEAAVAGIEQQYAMMEQMR